MSASQPKGLGKGLGALLQDVSAISEDVRSAVVELKINDISPNNEQPRRNFDQDRMHELAASIRENGVIQPIIVCRTQTGYKIVAGERRWRAARLAGLSVIPAIIRELTDVQILQHALIENIQRQDLNPLEEASAFERLIKEYGMTQEKLSSVVGRSRPAIANTLRLLTLPADIRRMVEREDLSAGHARTLLALPEKTQQIQAAKLVLDRGFSVRDTERLVKQMMAPPKSRRRQEPAYELSVKDVERRLEDRLGAKVRLRDRAGKGMIVIHYATNDELQRLIELIENVQA